MPHRNATVHLSREALDGIAAAARGKSREASSFKIPYAVYINGALSGRFDDLRDAIASARIAKQERPIAIVVVMESVTGKMAIEVEA
jgi:predicted pyridoxine 5'-phosphate oxidase superfamily flavin-nucleotide-binding protein